MNAGAELNKLRPRIEKTCTQCGMTYTAYKESGDVCRKCYQRAYNTQYKREQRAKAKQANK